MSEPAVAEATCLAALPADIGVIRAWLACGRPATAVYDYACIHEHVRRRGNCPDHEPEPGAVTFREVTA